MKLLFLKLIIFEENTSFKSLGMSEKTPPNWTCIPTQVQCQYLQKQYYMQLSTLPAESIPLGKCLSSISRAFSNCLLFMQTTISWNTDRHLF